jgi:anthranilate synthase component I
MTRLDARRMNIKPDFATFEAAWQTGQTVAVCVPRIDDLETPVSALAKLGPAVPGACLFESVEGGETRGRYSIVACQPDLLFEIDASGPKRTIIHPDGSRGEAIRIEAKPLDALRRLIEETSFPFPADLPPPAAGLYGYLAYEMVSEVEKLPANSRDPLELPRAMLWRPQIVIVFDGVKQELLLTTTARPDGRVDAANAYQAACERLAHIWTLLDQPTPLRAPAPDAQPTAIASTSTSFTPEGYMAAVEKAKDYIRAGDIFQVVPSQRFSAPFPASPLALYRSLRRTNPSPFLFLLQMDGFSIVGSSPEILVRLRDGTVTVRPIAGTRPRGTTPALDRAMAEELLADPKERAEHLMLLDLGRNDVGRVSQSRSGHNGGPDGGGVRVTDSFFVERYSHVMHIVSNVEGQIKPGLDALDALLAGFPAGTVSGAPKVRAMEIISELEPHERGVYGGGVGYFSAGGDMDLAIALRTAVLKDGHIHVQAGAGVVLDSVPLSEHTECVNKAMALFRAAADASLYEPPAGE